MCGIVGYVGKKQVVPVILDGLRRLEYRGYDSAGIAVAGNGEGLQIRRAEGKLRNLEEVIRLKPLDGTYGIGHTRWATHGRPTEENAHPHRDCTGKIVVVHNGIVENYLSLKKKLIEEGHKFTTETDTEIIAHLVEKYLFKTGNGHRPTLEDAVRKTVKELSGVFALAVISTDEPNKIVAARNGPPAVIGLGNDEYFVASDVPAILYHTRDIFFLADGDLAVITPQGVQLTDFDGQPIQRQVQHVTWDPIMAEKGGFKHFMLKEIYEQPRAVRDTTLGRVSQDTGHIFLDEMEISEAGVPRREEDQHRGLRNQLARRAGGQVHDRKPGAGPGGSGLRQRMALPRSHRWSGHHHAGDFAIRRNRRHHRRAARSQSQRFEDAGHLQRGGLDDHARGRRHDLYARRPGDWRGLHQGLHLPADRTLSVRAVPGAGARRDDRRAGAGRGAGTHPHSRQTREHPHPRRSLRRPGQAVSSGRRIFFFWDAAFTIPSRSKARSS